MRQLCGAVISQQGRRIDRLTDTATTLMARDYKGFGNQAMNAVMEITPPPAKSSRGIMVGTSEKFNAGMLKDISRSITTEGKNGVVEWKSNTK